MPERERWSRAAIYSQYSTYLEHILRSPQRGETEKQNTAKVGLLVANEYYLYLVDKITLLGVVCLLNVRNSALFLKPSYA